MTYSVIVPYTIRYSDLHTAGFLLKAGFHSHRKSSLCMLLFQYCRHLVGTNLLILSFKSEYEISDLSRTTL